MLVINFENIHLTCHIHSHRNDSIVNIWCAKVIFIIWNSNIHVGSNNLFFTYFLTLVFHFGADHCIMGGGLLFLEIPLTKECFLHLTFHIHSIFSLHNIDVLVYQPGRPLMYVSSSALLTKIFFSMYVAKFNPALPKQLSSWNLLSLTGC